MQYKETQEGEYTYYDFEKPKRTRAHTYSVYIETDRSKRRTPSRIKFTKAIYDIVNDKGLDCVRLRKDNASGVLSFVFSKEGLKIQTSDPKTLCVANYELNSFLRASLKNGIAHKMSDRYPLSCDKSESDEFAIFDIGEYEGHSIN